jgi:hypothetical protein
LKGTGTTDGGVAEVDPMLQTKGTCLERRRDSYVRPGVHQDAIMA